MTVLCDLWLQRETGPLRSGVLVRCMPCGMTAWKIPLLKRRTSRPEILPLRPPWMLNTACSRFLILSCGPRCRWMVPTALSSVASFLSVKHLYRTGTSMLLVVASVPSASRSSEGG